MIEDLVMHLATWPISLWLVIENGYVLARSDFADAADTFALFKLVVPWPYRHAQRMPKEDFGQAGERESLRRCGTSFQAVCRRQDICKITARTSLPTQLRAQVG